MTAKCIYCLATSGDIVHEYGTTRFVCYRAYDCRDRMLSREKRIVRVFWRVRVNSSNAVAFICDRYSPKAARLWPGYTFFRVTVRRKGKG